MELKVFRQKSANLFGENRLLKFAIMVLLAFSLSNWMAIREALNTTRTVLVPLGAQGDLWVSANDASDSYLRQTARYVTHMAFDYTASTARPQFEELLHLLKPDSYSNYKAAFDTLATDIERFPTVSSRHRWIGKSPLTVSGDRKQLVIQATKERIVDGQVTRQSDITMTIDFVIEDGQFWIKDMREEQISERIIK